MEWGAESGHMQVGIGVFVTFESATQVDFRVEFHWRPVSWPFNDDQTLNISGSSGNSSHNYLALSSEINVAQRYYSVQKSFSGGPTFEWYAQVSGAYNGATPFHYRSFTVPARQPTPPGAPGFQFNGAINSTSVYLDWLAPADNGAPILEYQIWFNTAPTGAGIAWQSQAGNDTDRDYTGLTRATRYYWGVRARNSAGWGPFSNESNGWWVETASTVPDAPVAATFASILATSTTVNITAPNNGGAAIDDYHVQVYRDSGLTQLQWEDPTVTTSLSYGVTALTRATQYWVRYRAHNSIGWGAWSPTATFTTASTVPSVPLSPSMSAVDADSVSVSWSPPTDTGGQTVTSYDVRYSADASFATGSTTINDNASPLQIDGLTPGTPYYAQVRAVNSVGAGSWSNAVTVTTLQGVRYWNGSTFPSGVVYYWNGTSWLLPAEIRYWDGDSFELPVG